MKDANTILFETLFDGKPLFRNQLDLVTQLISTGVYVYDFNDKEDFNKLQIRLKTYISQLLSETAVRSITDDFKKSLDFLLVNRIKDEQLRLQVFEKIIYDLKIKNSPIVKSESKVFPFQHDILSNNYISVISAKPIGIDRPKNDDEFSLRDFLFKDFVLTFFIKKSQSKYYRFNFPLESYCELFWLGFQKMIALEINQLISTEAFSEIFVTDNFLTNTSLKELYYEYKSLPSNIVNSEKAIDFKNKISFFLSINLIEYLNKNKFILTFHVTDPIYSSTTVAIRPDNLNAGKVYFLIDDEEEKKPQLIKLNSESFLLWRIFVWDKIKTSKNSKNIEFPTLRSIAPAPESSI